jgi:hypothetical protein
LSPGRKKLQNLGDRIKQLINSRPLTPETSIG